MIVFTAILPSLGPIPVDFGRVLQGQCRDVTCLAGDRSKMGVDSLIYMCLIHMALVTRDLFLWIDCVIVGNHTTKDLMFGGPMTVDTLHIEVTAHMNVIALRGEIKAFIQVTVLDAVSTATVEMTFSAILPRRGTN